MGRGLEADEQWMSVASWCNVSSCPDLSPFQFPFYNTTDTRCGLIKVNCTLGNERIQFGGQSYEITGKDYPGPHVNIHNTTFQKLVEAKSCEALVNNFTSPTPQLFSISIRPHVTFFKCPKDSHYGAKFDVYFNKPNYKSYNGCKDHNFYYKHPNSLKSAPSDLPHGCQVIRLPGGQVPNYTDIFSLLTSQFRVHFWSPSCNECLQKDNCHQKHENFKCSDAKKDVKLILILVLTGSAFILMLSTAIFIISHRYKNNPFLYFLSKDKSPNPEDGSLFFGVSVFSYAELEDATKNFDPSHVLGDGGFGAVYYGKLQDGREVAVKRLYDHNYKRLTDKSDVYSFGVVLIELISSMAAVDLSRSQDEISLANLALNRIQRCAIDQLIDPVLGSNSNPEIKNMVTSVAELAFRCLQFDSDMRPTMNEVLDVLMEVQAERRTDGGDNIRDLEPVNSPSLSENNDSVVLLKDFPPSPVSVTRQWQSDNSASTTVSSNGDRLPMKIVSVTI
ncbi:hypothetical protein L1987_16647 [Smallanthus sonchifolius]|uniref:Uncharacterized protein n=1 Tax=Smallanthus sonchifolius TaxID=185202 RepID=A0ACB9IV91_9ASTR|nr:hypothetical protein L1987_16647 [Smallanthus sonchifolius]